MEHDAFLQAILDAPDDDTPRLIYADWLDEHGDATRAEFIRIQCQLAGATLGNGDQRELEMRDLELLARNQEEWATPVRDLVDAWQFRRGFVGHVRVEGQLFAAAPEAVLRKAPVQSVELFWGLVQPLKRAQILARAFSCPDLSRLRTFDVNGNYIGSDGTQALAGCDHLAGLAVLRMSHNHIGDGGMRALAAASFLPNLTDLILNDNDIGPPGVRCLIAAFHAHHEAGITWRLKTLDLRSNRLGMAGRREIQGERSLRRITLL